MAEIVGLSIEEDMLGVGGSGVGPGLILVWVLRGEVVVAVDLFVGIMGVCVLIVGV